MLPQSLKFKGGDRFWSPKDNGVVFRGSLGARAFEFLLPLDALGSLSGLRSLPAESEAIRTFDEFHWRAIAAAQALWSRGKGQALYYTISLDILQTLL